MSQMAGFRLIGKRKLVRYNLLELLDIIPKKDF